MNTLPNQLTLQSLNITTDSNYLSHKQILNLNTVMDDQDIEIGEAFDLMDTKRCGEISTRDIKIAIKALGLELPRDQYIKLISGIERNQKGFVRKETFMKEMRKQLSRRDVKGDMIKAFQLFDEHDTGKIDFNNLKSIASLIGERISDQEITNMLEAADEDGDGKVNQTEFLKLMNRATKFL